MRSIEKRFLLEEDKAPLSSTYINFVRAIKGQNFSEAIIKKWFSKLVDKNDYDKAEKKEVVDYLVANSNSN